MADVLRILDAKDLRDSGTETVLFDLNDPTGATNATLEPLGYATVETRFAAGGGFQLNSPEFEFIRFSGTGPGGTTVGSEAGFAVSSWGQRIDATSYDILAQAVGYLGRLLLQGGVIKWVPHGSANTRYIDFEPSPTPALLDGRPHALDRATNFFDTAEGVTVAIVRQPYLRGPELNATSNPALSGNPFLVNPTLLHDQDGTTGTPDSWAWDSTSNITSQNIDAADQAFEFTIATAAARNLQQSTGAASASNGDTWTLSFYARSTAAGAKAAPVIEYMSAVPAVLTTSTVTLTALTTQWQRLSVTFTATNASTNRIRANLRVDNDDATSYVVQFRNVQLEKASAASTFRVGTQTIYTDPASTSGPGRTMAVWNPGDVPTLAQVTVANTPARVEVGVRSNTYKPGSAAIPTWLNSAKFLQCESMTNGTDTTSQANANASGGNVKRTTYVTASMVNRANYDPGAPGLAGGDWLVAVRVANITAQPTTHALKLTWGFTGTTYDQFEEAEVTYTSTSTTGFDHVPLSVVHLPEDAVSFSIGLWSERVSGTGNLEWDVVTFIPAERFGRLTNPTGETKIESRSADEAVLLNSSDILQGYAEVEGMVPALLNPGLNGLYIAPLTVYPSGADTHYGSAIADSATVTVTVTPKYLT